MSPLPSPLGHQAAAYFQALQTRLIKSFEDIDLNHKFNLTPWQKAPQEILQGSGQMALLRGSVFEKLGINFSQVHGTFPEPFRKEIPGAIDSEGKFWASGVSLVCHPANPHLPAVHFNVRRIETSKAWFGGGADLTPCLPNEGASQHFHQSLEKACLSYQADAYPRFKKWADEYFFLPHRNEPRGIGGIFFDYLEDQPEATFSFVQTVAEAFGEAYFPLAKQLKDKPFTAEDKHTQLLKRGRYAEFNLLYDRGTRFGLQSGGNTEAILMSLPPEARW